MIQNLKIEVVDHPHIDLMRRWHKPTTYVALTWEDVNEEGYSRGTSHLNINYVEDTLKDYLRTKFISNVDYLEALVLVNEYKGRK